MSYTDPVLSASRILDASRAAQAADDTGVVDWALDAEFIVAVQLDEQMGPWTAVYKLQWRQTGGTFADLGAASEISYGTGTVLEDGTAVVIGEKACTNTPSASWTDGWEVEGTGTASSLALSDEDYTELHFAIDPANADNEQAYEFRLWDVTNGAQTGICVATLTTEAAGGTEYPQSAAGSLTATGELTAVAQKALAGAITATGELEASKGIVFEDGFEDGTKDAWETDVGAATVSVGAAQAGTDYGLEIDSGSQYVGADIVINSDAIMLRWYLDVNTFDISTPGELIIASFLWTGSAYTFLVQFKNNGGTLQLSPKFYDDENSAHSGIWVNLTGAKYYEFLIVRETADGANDGWGQWWMEGVSQDTITSIGNYDRVRETTILALGGAGAWAASASGIFYLDEAVIRDDDTEIGAVVGGTETPKSVAGSLTAMGNVATRAQKLLAGSITAAGTVIKQTTQAITGSLAATGEVVKQTIKSALAGSTTAAGIVGGVKTSFKALSGSLTATGNVVKQGAQSLSGSITGAGVSVKGMSKNFAGQVQTTGVIFKQTVLLPLLGSILGAGVVSGIKAAFKELFGSLTATGGLAKQTLKPLAGALVAAGELVKNIPKAFAGSLTAAGALAKQIPKAFSGSLSATGNVVKGSFLALSGSVQGAGALLPKASKYLAGQATATGALVKQTLKPLAGVLAATGAIRKQVNRLLAGAMAASGFLSKIITGLAGRGTVDITVAVVYPVTAGDAGLYSVSIADAEVYSVTVSEEVL